MTTMRRPSEGDDADIEELIDMMRTIEIDVLEQDVNKFNAWLRSEIIDSDSEHQTHYLNNILMSWATMINDVRSGDWTQVEPFDPPGWLAHDPKDDPATTPSEMGFNQVTQRVRDLTRRFLQVAHNYPAAVLNTAELEKSYGELLHELSTGWGDASWTC